MKGQKQHYVPKAFLKEFTNTDNKFYQAKIKARESKEKIKIIDTHPASVCYLPDFYRIPDEGDLKPFRFRDSKNYLEERGFLYENYLVKALSAIKARDRFLERRDYVLIIDSYLSLKQRNPYYRTQYAYDKFVAGIMDNVAQSFLDENKWLRDLPNINAEQIIADFKERELNDPNRAKNSHLGTLIDTAKGRSEIVRETSLRFIEMDVVIFQAGKSDFFIVSDNPGYTLKPFNNQIGVYNTDFGEFDQVVLPVNSKQAIVFINKSSKSLNLIKPLRLLRYINIDSEEVFEINKSSTFCTTSKVFCENKEYLERFIDRLIKDGVLSN